MSDNKLKNYLQDPFLNELMQDIKSAGSIRSSLVDITHKCNLRCDGCYYFSENMDQYKKVETDDEFFLFVQQEVERGTNMLTIVGGEPALEIDRLKILAKHFLLTVVTNGSINIPLEGLENIRIAISFWGDEQRDIELRGNGKNNIFDTALTLFKNDPRAGFYYTTIPGFTAGIHQATTKMINNGNFVTFNFYGDLSEKGGKYSHKNGFDDTISEITRMISLFPTKVMSSPYINQVISNRKLFDQTWGYQVCPSVTFDHPENSERMLSGKKYPTKFRAYNADLKTTRRCCIGNARDCSTCTDLWAIYGWVIGSMKAHLKTKSDFTHWLCTVYIFYIQTGFLDWNEKSSHLPKIYHRFQIKDRQKKSKNNIIPTYEYS